MLELKNVTCGYKTPKRNHIVINEMSLRVDPGEVLCILGANGVGKTTLFQSIMGNIPVFGGEVLINEVSMFELSARERAKKIAYVPQIHNPSFPYSVKDMIAMGLAPYLSSMAAPGYKEMQRVEQLLDEMGEVHLLNKNYMEISGGERQMVLIARAILQNTEILMMDEPTANLDFGNQIKILKQIRHFATTGKIIIFTTHNPDHACLCADRIAAIKSPEEYTICEKDGITEELIYDLYHIQTKMIQPEMSEGDIRKICVPYI